MDNKMNFTPTKWTDEDWQDFFNGLKEIFSTEITAFSAVLEQQMLLTQIHTLKTVTDILDEYNKCTKYMPNDLVGESNARRRVEFLLQLKQDFQKDLENAEANLQLATDLWKQLTEELQKKFSHEGGKSDEASRNE